jgi:hypothetical protein
MGSEPKPAGLAFMWQITAAPTDREILDPRFELGAGVGFKREECIFDSSEIKLVFSFRRVGADRESRAVLNVKNNMRASSDQSVQPYNSEAGEACMGIYLRALGGRALNEPQYPAPERVLPAGVRVSNSKALDRLAESPNLCIVSEIHGRSLRQRLKNWSETLREDRNGKSTGTDAKAACVRKGNDRPPRPGRVQAEAA